LKPLFQVGDLFAALKARLSDTNKNLVGTTVTVRTLYGERKSCESSGVSGGRSLTRRWYPVPGATRTSLGFGICPSFQGPLSVAPCQPQSCDSQLFHRDARSSSRSSLRMGLQHGEREDARRSSGNTHTPPRARSSRLERARLSISPAQPCFRIRRNIEGRRHGS
jgi:hypothetical protein